MMTRMVIQMMMPCPTAVNHQVMMNQNQTAVNWSQAQLRENKVFH
jgi:hypothetical protein